MLLHFCVNEIDGTVAIFVRSYINLKHSVKSDFDKIVISVKLPRRSFTRNKSLDRLFEQ